jgi:small GTP-binding protein
MNNVIILKVVYIFLYLMEYKIEECDGSEQEKFSIKIVLVGDSGVGKSNILNRFVFNEFSHDSKSTVGVELNSKSFIINNTIIKVQLWDTAGQERYKSITSAYYKGARGALIIYDITKTESFKSVDKWFREIKEYGEKNVVTLLVGNKCDLKQLRSVETLTALEKGKTLGIPYLETSAADSTNVEEAFKKIILGEITH